MRRLIARHLRRIAQRLSPLLTEKQIRELREEFCCGQTYVINVNSVDEDLAARQSLANKQALKYTGR